MTGKTRTISNFIRLKLILNIFQIIIHISEHKNNEKLLTGINPEKLLVITLKMKNTCKNLSIFTTKNTKYLTRLFYSS